MIKRDVGEKQNRSIFKAATTVLITIFLTLSITRVVLANILATSGQRLAAANQKIEILVEQNQSLENQVSELGSLSRIDELAQKMGMVKADNVQVLLPSSPIANR